ncbi:hypothetical protein ACFFKE_26925 [Streptomyces mutabilis]|uniref:hypothetical protein n=1 Tax=Streptomyces mutabilis TaxID=67332 RepID=UPI00198445E3|nr:hypothetical protein [Streptomyces mutabilis]GGQ11109.1 hypothetical protein GCM10010279_18260 [Streptomyces mutabilis]
MALAQSFEARRDLVGRRITVRIALSDDSTAQTPVPSRTEGRGVLLIDAEPQHPLTERG